MMYNLTSCHDTVLRQSGGCVTCLAWHRRSAEYFQRTFCGKRASRSDGRRPHINLSNATSLPAGSTRIHAWVTRWQANVWAFRAGRCGVGASAGPWEIFPWRMSQDGAARPMFPPLDQAVVKAVACELGADTKQPLSRQSLADVTARVRRALGKPISRSTVWRILATDAIKLWRYKYSIFPRDPHFAEKAGPILDLYAGTW